jgi:hypothetical protein
MCGKSFVVVAWIQSGMALPEIINDYTRGCQSFVCSNAGR